jgi:Cu(I)/Ag(I) efflux system membrane fusion protein
MEKTFIKSIWLISGLAVVFLVAFNWGSIADLIYNDTFKDETAVEHARAHLEPNYVCPMHSQITDNEASACPICGMDLELRELAQSDAMDSEAVFISAAMVNNLGIRLEHVEMGSVSEQVYGSGNVNRVLPAQQKDITSKVDGKLKDIQLKDGSWVEEEDVLLSIDVTGYEALLNEYLDAMDIAEIQTALKLRKRLVAMGAGADTLAGFNDDKPLSKYLEIVAPFSGEISWITSDDNTDIKIGDKLVQITAPAIAEVGLRSYSRLARGVKIGNTGKLGVSHLPGRTWPGRVVDIQHNFVGLFSSIAFHVDVPAGLLEAGSFGSAYINAGTSDNVLRVPASAVIFDEDSIRVIRLTSDDRFEVVKVSLGFEGHEWIEIKSGLQQGDHVVTRGQFLIDSEATLQAGFKRLSAPAN